MSEFTKLRKVTAGFVTSVLLPLWKNSALAGRIFDILCGTFINRSRKFVYFAIGQQ